MSLDAYDSLLLSQLDDGGDDTVGKSRRESNVRSSASQASTSWSVLGDASADKARLRQMTDRP